MLLLQHLLFTVVTETILLLLLRDLPVLLLFDHDWCGLFVKWDLSDASSRLAPLLRSSWFTNSTTSHLVVIVGLGVWGGLWCRVWRGGQVRNEKHYFSCDLLLFPKMRISYLGYIPLCLHL